ncbi:hypothetical protein Lal_00036986 [Lupinus albus]|uniref:Putative Late embryogenesis abundant protein, LEA-14 n=1 Tax=Lupinus albus TaxID=3870 RepID=A0A6A5PKG3_LUPAL|nr:putative Late embryogenesis abundant protein, LEA-14 [Lupinus albus]KAF1897544.1 hypothetical protein Lal_00036986 [Lupinus albus]
MHELASSSKGKSMVDSEDKHDDEEQVLMNLHKKMMLKKRRRGCVICIGMVMLLLIMILIISLILAFTLFKTKEPKTKLVSATFQGIAPRISLPVIDIQLNVTLDLKILVENPNRASFKHEEGKSVLLYKGNEVGETKIYKGYIPAKGSATLPCRLTLEADELASNVTTLIGDLMRGQLTVDAITRIPGKVTLLGFIKKHIIANSYCQFTFGIPDLKIESQICKTKTKL